MDAEEMYEKTLELLVEKGEEIGRLEEVRRGLEREVRSLQVANEGLRKQVEDLKEQLAAAKGASFAQAYEDFNPAPKDFF